LLVRDLGERWETEVLGYKPHAACAASHTSIDAAVYLREQGVRAEDIERVTIQASTHSVDHVGWNYVPDTVTTAQMNLSFAVASAFLDGRVGVDQFREDRLADPTLLALASRVDAVADPAIDDRGLRYSHAVVMTVRTREGRTWTKSCEHGLGSEHHPLSDEVLLDKFRDQACRVLPGDVVDELAATVMALEQLDDVIRLGQLVARTARATV
jgi:2-methylcitrate dehydratase PrpD